MVLQLGCLLFGPIHSGHVIWQGQALCEQPVDFVSSLSFAQVQTEGRFVLSNLGSVFTPVTPKLLQQLV